MNFFLKYFLFVIRQTRSNRFLFNLNWTWRWFYINGEKCNLLILEIWHKIQHKNENQTVSYGKSSYSDIFLLVLKILRLVCVEITISYKNNKCNILGIAGWMAFHLVIHQRCIFYCYIDSDEHDKFISQIKLY